MSDHQERTSRGGRLQSTAFDRERVERGQIDLRFILGLIVLILLAGPLVTAALDIQASLASTQAFSWFSAGIIALLIVAVIVAGILGLE